MAYGAPPGLLPAMPENIIGALFVENLGRFLDGKPLKEVVDRKLGY